MGGVMGLLTGPLPAPKDVAEFAARPRDLACEPAGDSPGCGVPSDAELIAQSVREPGAFAAVFDRHADEILRYAHASLGADLAEDVMAETFLAAFRARARYDTSRADARPWLYGIAIRQIGSHRRAEARWRRLLAAAPADMAAEDFTDRSANRVVAASLRPQLLATLNSLRRQDRELLLLHAWAGLSYEESAAALGLTVSAVKSRLHRIRIKIKAALGDANPLTLMNTKER
jgi:RNA polymerase sigma-70 factor (ECF subfamily)